MTDKRPIDANALYEDVSRMGLTNGSALGRHSGMADAIAQMIRDAPTIDPESLRGHAKWEKPENLAWDNLERVKVTIICEAMALVLSGEYEEAGA